MGANISPRRLVIFGVVNDIIARVKRDSDKERGPSCECIWIVAKGSLGHSGIKIIAEAL